GAQMLFEEGLARDKVALAESYQLGHLPFDAGVFGESAAQHTPGHTVFLLNQRRFAGHIGAHADIGRLTVLMIAVVDDINGDVADAAIGTNELHHENIITAVLELLVAVAIQAQVHRLFDKERLVVDHIEAVTDDLAIETDLLPPEDFLAGTIHENDVAEQAVPLRVLVKGGGDFSEHARTVTIVRI